MSHRPHSPQPLFASATLVGLVFLFLTVPAGPASAQTPTEMIQEFAETASGFALMGEIERGSLQAERQMTFLVEFQAGVDYMVVGFCDESCTDLDLAILDPSGEGLNSDYLPDAQPVLIITPEVQGHHQVRVDMVGCSVESCVFSVGIFEGDLRESFGLLGADMDDRMNLFRTDLPREGFSQTEDPESGSLDEGQEIWFPVPLVEGREYRFVGVCDNDCGDFDLILYSPSGREVESDALPDPVPIITFTSPSTAEYQMAALMLTCAVEPCAFMVATFVRGEGVGPGGVPITGVIVSQETHQGALEAGDEQLAEGEYFDEYTFDAEAGQTVIVDVRSPDFDTYLILETPDGDEEQNDDWGDDTMHSHIEMVAPVTGTYSVLVTSFVAEEIGTYTLQLAVVAGS